MIVFQHADILDAASGTLLRDRFVRVDGDLIAEVPGCALGPYDHQGFGAASRLVRLIAFSRLPARQQSCGIDAGGQRLHQVRIGVLGALDHFGTLPGEPGTHKTDTFIRTAPRATCLHQRTTSDR